MSQQQRRSYDTNQRRLPNGIKNDTSKNQDREQYYKFYLDSAQRAIEMMRK
jgi:hypothetical protein